MSEVILFKKCLGFTDAKSVATQMSNPETGETQLIECSNLTVTDDGCLETPPELSVAYTHTASVTRVSAGSRLFFGDGIDIYELSGATAAKRFPILDGPMSHSLLDVRVSGSTKVYKSVNPTGAATEAVAGTNPGPSTSVAYAGMPLFSGGFMHGARLCSYTGKFLQYSAPYSYDLWDIGNGFIPHQFSILQAGSIPGVLVCTHTEGVSTYIAGDIADPQTSKRFYPCQCITKTLYSGFISKALGHGHVFMCADGIYTVGQDGAISRLTGNSLEFASELNTTYTGAIVTGGKYLAYGNNVCVEYDFRTQAVMLRASGVTAATVLKDVPYLAYGSTVSTLAAAPNTSACSFTLPYSTLGDYGRKYFDSLYVTGQFDGSLTITARQQDIENTERWSLTVDPMGIVQNQRIKLPKGTVGSKVSFRFDTDYGITKIEEIRAVFSSGNRR